MRHRLMQQGAGLYPARAIAVAQALPWFKSPAARTGGVIGIVILAILLWVVVALIWGAGIEPRLLIDEVHADGWIDGAYGRTGNRLYVNQGIGLSVVPVRVNLGPEITWFSLKAS